MKEDKIKETEKIIKEMNKMKENKNKFKISKKFIIILISIVLLAIIGTFSYIMLRQDKQEDKIIELTLIDNTKFEYKDEIKVSELIKQEDEITLLNGEDLLKTDELGEQEQIIKYKYNESEYEKTIKYEVVDTTKPELTIKNEVIETEEGKEINLLDNVESAKDNYDGEELKDKVTVEGEYDYNEVGEYKLKYILKDSSDNEIEKDFTLKVNEKKQEVAKQTQQSSNTNKNTNNSNKNNTNNKPSQNNSNDEDVYTVSEADQAYGKSLYDKYYAIYGDKLSKTQQSFSPEPGVTVYTVNSPVVFHYEWNIINDSWNVVIDKGYADNITRAVLRELYPAPARQGNEIRTEGADGSVNITGEKYGSYQAYAYGVRVLYKGASFY